MLLKELSLCCGPSGMEKETREYIKRTVDGYGLPYFTDNVGNLIVHNIGNKSNGTMAVFAPMDESGFVVSSIEKDGFIKFKTCGSINPHCLIAKTVRIIPSGVQGVIGSCLFKHIEKSVFGRVVDPEKLYIDIGCNSEKETANKVRIGDRVLFEASYEELGEKRVKLRSADSKAACAILMNLLKKKPKEDFYACFCVVSTFDITVGDDSGKAFMGGLCAANHIQPDCGILLTGIEARDVPGQKEYTMISALGNGIILKQWSGSYVYDKRLTARVETLARTKNIPLQFLRGNDRDGFCGSTLAGIAEGIRLIELSVPCRYRNTPVSTIDKRDIQSGIDLIFNLITEFDWRL